MSDQLQMFNQKTYPKSTRSLSDLLAKILASLENVKGWKEVEAHLLAKQLDSSANADQTFLYGKMLKGLSPQTLARTFGQLSKPLPTLGVIDSNGNCLIQSGFYPKIERESTLSDILEEKVEDKYFLSKKLMSTLIKRSGTKQGKQQVSKIHIHEQ